MICGIDEAGRGPVIGPLVVAGVKCENEIQLKEIHVHDSKKYTPIKRTQLAEKIKRIILGYELLIIPASDIDAMRKVMTLNEIEVYAFSKILDKLKADICYIDSADVNEKRFGEHILVRLSFQPKIISKHKADELYPVVGAASILAKTKRDEIVCKIERRLRKKLDLPLGSGYPADPVTQQFLKIWLEKYKVLPPHVRCSWKTTQKLLSKQHRKRLDDFV